MLGFFFLFDLNYISIAFKLTFDQRFGWEAAHDYKSND